MALPFRLSFLQSLEYYLAFNNLSLQLALARGVGGARSDQGRKPLR